MKLTKTMQVKVLFGLILRELEKERNGFLLQCLCIQRTQMHHLLIIMDLPNKDNMFLHQQKMKILISMKLTKTMQVEVLIGLIQLMLEISHGFLLQCQLIQRMAYLHGNQLISMDLLVNKNVMTIGMTHKTIQKDKDLFGLLHHKINLL